MAIYLSCAKLIADLEAASEGSAELGGRIICAVRGWEFVSVKDITSFPCPYVNVVFNEGYGNGIYPGLDPSRSIDGAVALVPKGWTVGHISQGDNKLWNVELREGYLTSYNRVVFGPGDHKGRPPALALSIAILKSMEK
jgi:hypothetical protein